MHTPIALVPCASCACHHRASEPSCPHCGSASSGRPAAALLLGLALASGCFGKSVAMYGAAITAPPGDTAASSLSAAIAAPADGASVVEGEVEVDAVVTDGDVTDLTVISVAWSVDGAAVCADAKVDASGDASCTVTLAEGDHDVAVVATAPDSGSSSEATITLHVTADGAS